MNTFDPWHCAELFLLVEADPEDGATRRMWAQEHSSYQAAQAEHERVPGVHSPREQLKAAEECLRLRPAIEADDGGAVLDAIAHCAAQGLALPQWLATVYLRRHGAVGRGEARGWEDQESFGTAYAKGTNIAGVRAFVRHAGPAYIVAAQLLAEAPGRPIDTSLYEEVGERLGVGQTRVQDLIAEYLALSGAIPLKNLRKQLLDGHTFEEARAFWDKARHDAWLRAAGFAPDADGNWRPIE